MDLSKSLNCSTHYCNSHHDSTRRKL
jgi:hypothetical protein